MIRVTRTWTIGSKNGYLLCTKNQTSPEKMDSVAVAMPRYYVYPQAYHPQVPGE